MVNFFGIRLCPHAERWRNFGYSVAPAHAKIWKSESIPTEWDESILVHLYTKEQQNEVK